MGFMSSMVSLRPLVLNQSKDSVWTEIRSGTSRICGNLENDLRGLGVFLSPKGDHSSHPWVFCTGLNAQTCMLSPEFTCNKPGCGLPIGPPTTRLALVVAAMTVAPTQSGCRVSGRLVTSPPE